jgi:transcriptional/translational regulatory protein YebC/TACO1
MKIFAEGGNVDPAKNSRLKSVMEIAKKMNMPSESVQRILKASEVWQYNYQGKFEVNFNILGPRCQG